MNYRPRNRSDLPQNNELDEGLLTGTSDGSYRPQRSHVSNSNTSAVGRPRTSNAMDFSYGFSTSNYHVSAQSSFPQQSAAGRAANAANSGPSLQVTDFLANTISRPFDVSLNFPPPPVNRMVPPPGFNASVPPPQIFNPSFPPPFLPPRSFGSIQLPNIPSQFLPRPPLDNVPSVGVPPPVLPPHLPSNVPPAFPQISGGSTSAADNSMSGISQHTSISGMQQWTSQPPADSRAQMLNDGDQQLSAFNFRQQSGPFQHQFHSESSVLMPAFVRPPTSVAGFTSPAKRYPLPGHPSSTPFHARPDFRHCFGSPLQTPQQAAAVHSHVPQPLRASHGSDQCDNFVVGQKLQLPGTVLSSSQTQLTAVLQIPPTIGSSCDKIMETPITDDQAVVPLSKRRHRFCMRKLTGVAEFRCLLREAILLSEQLKKYYQKYHCVNLENQASAVQREDHVNDSEIVADYLSSTSSSQNEAADSVLMLTAKQSDVVSQSCLMQPEDSGVQNISQINSIEKRTVRLVLSNIKLEQPDNVEMPVENDDLDCAQIQLRLGQLQTLLTETVGKVQLRLKRVSKKRKRVKHLRQQLYKEKQEMESQRQKCHQEMEKWENEMQLQAANAKMEREMKKAADATLSEVRRKISDAHHRLALLSKLRKLRHLRKEQAERKGIVTSKSADKMFEERVNALSSFLKEQLVNYEAEQRTLQVMLETEQEETKKKKVPTATLR